MLPERPTDEAERTHSLLHVVGGDARLHFAKVNLGDGPAFIYAGLHDIGEECEAAYGATACRVLYNARGLLTNPLLRDSNLGCGNCTPTSHMIGAISTRPAAATPDDVKSNGRHTLASLPHTPDWIIFTFCALDSHLSCLFFEHAFR